jgi:ketosteroid isomerase-like protein
MYKKALLFLLATSITAVAPFSKKSTAIAATSDTAPTELVNAISSLDAAASKKDINAVMQFYAPNFAHGDGLTRQKLRDSLEGLWKSYTDIKYNTKVTKWERKGNTYTVETMTQIQGTKPSNHGEYKLDAQLVSTQVYQPNGSNLQISRQDIVSEKSFLTSGEKPPKVELRMPDKIGVGRQYSLDAVIPEPIGHSLLLGTIVEEDVSAENYLKDSTVELEPLRAGGVFKIGQAPYTTGDRWISVVLIQETGITISSQRLRVSKDVVGNQYKSLPEALTTPSRVRPAPNFQQTL